MSEVVDPFQFGARSIAIVCILAKIHLGMTVKYKISYANYMNTTMYKTM